MLELLINPKKAEKKPWEMFFIGAFYALLSLFLVKWIFYEDPVLFKYSGILVVTFCVIFSLPFMYYALRYEEEKDLSNKSLVRLIKEHGKALLYFIFLFLGFVVVFSIWYIVFEDGNKAFIAQVETFCLINKPSYFDLCLQEYGIKKYIKSTTGFSAAKEKIINIFSNNLYVLMFTIIFSLIFGAGAIFILAWNASVIAAAIGIFSKSDLAALPLGIMRYMIHGIPEIAAYFIGAIAGGIISFAVIKHDTKSEKFWIILQDSLNLIIAAIIILFFAALIEVFITPMLF